MHGILLIDKPEGLSSHDVVRKVRRIFATRKVGHAGTLDPLATGVLVVAVGDGTKILQFLFSDEKSYRAVLKLGTTTDTYDSQGVVLINREVPPIDQSLLDSVCAKFRGTTKQIPPMFSALKRNGTPLYKLARQGLEVERETRQITIDRLAIIAVKGSEVTIEVDCSKGTYIRSLVYDLGESIGCGAHLTSLRRLRSGRFGIDQCYLLEDLEQLRDPGTALLSLVETLNQFPAVGLDQNAVQALSFGIPPQINQCRMENDIQEAELVLLLNGESLAAIARFQPSRANEKRGDFELIRVFL